MRHLKAKMEAGQEHHKAKSSQASLDEQSVQRIVAELMRNILPTDIHKMRDDIMEIKQHVANIEAKLAGQK